VCVIVTAFVHYVSWQQCHQKYRYFPCCLDYRGNGVKDVLHGLLAFDGVFPFDVKAPSMLKWLCHLSDMHCLVVELEYQDSVVINTTFQGTS